MKKIVLATKSLVPAVAIALLLAQATANAQGRLAAECPSEGALRSLSDTERTRISFRNERFGRIYVFWIDYEGLRPFYSLDRLLDGYRLYCEVTQKRSIVRE